MICPYCASTNPDTAHACQACGAHFNMAALANGTLLRNGDYRIGKVLGQGGFGVTYAANQIKLGRTVTIKEFCPAGTPRQNTNLRPNHSHAAEWPQMVLGFVQEASTIAQFSHPNIVKVSDVFEENNTAYYAMEFLDGQTLSGLCKKGSVAEDDAKKIMLDLCQALTVVHSKGLLHRDIKPDNIFIEKTGRVVLIDFGSARLYSGKTISVTQLITPGYAPLEQYAFKARFGPSTDIYALGATLFTMLTNQVPPSALDRMQNAALPWRGSEPIALRSAVEWAMQTDTKKRPQNVGEWAQRLNGGTATSSTGLFDTFIVLMIFAAICFFVWPKAQPGAQAVLASLQYKLGEMFSKGEIVRQSKPQAAYWYQKAAENGNVLGQYIIGWMYDYGLDVSENDFQAFYWYKKAAEQGNVESQAKLGQMYNYGRGVLKNDFQAFYWYKKAAEQGNTDVQFSLGLMYDYGRGVSENDFQAFYWYKKDAEQGNYVAQYIIGRMYDDGEGVSENDFQAFYWFKKAAEQGYADGQVNLGRMYNYGRGVSENDFQAFYWFKKSAEQNNAYGQNNLGVMYNYGQGVGKDYSQAFYWFKKSAEQNNAYGQNNLGTMYRDGQGVEKDYNQAFYWFKKSAEQNNADGQGNLGWMYEYGFGTTKNMAEAIRLYRLAAANNSEWAIKSLERLGIR
jgi:TPR repeat protein